MNKSQYQALLEESWRRPLTVEEEARLQAWLALHPEAQAEWESEASLTHLLERLPEAPVASNFTAQVMQGLDAGPGRAIAIDVPAGSWLQRLRGFLQAPGMRVGWAVLTVVMIAGLWYGYDRHLRDQRLQTAAGLTVLVNVTSLSDPVVLEDFEAIQRLSGVAPSVDEELFAVLNQ
jgi:hypothetical protein